MKTKTNEDPRAAAPAVRPSRPVQTADVEERGAIARRAYERFLQRGCEPGHDLDDWPEAERELTKQAG